MYKRVFIVSSRAEGAIMQTKRINGLERLQCNYFAVDTLVVITTRKENNILLSSYLWPQFEQIWIPAKWAYWEQLVNKKKKPMKALPTLLGYSTKASI